jgi:hypothetical protein
VEDDTQIQCRKLLLDFYGAQLNTHGRLIIGFSVIVFTIVGIRNSIQKIVLYQTIILYSAIFLALFAFLYSLFRHLTYGQLCGAVMFTPWNPEFEKGTCNELIGKFSDEVDRNVRIYRKRIVLVVPTDWFIGSSRYTQKFGVILCAILSIVTVILFYLTIG